MSKINSLKNIRNNLEELCSITDVLKTDLPQVYKFILNDNFIPIDLEKRTAESLCKLSHVQENIEHEFTSLKIGNLPDKTSKMAPILDEYQEKWEKQDKYLGIVKFFLSLHSEDKVIETLLDTRKEQLKQLDLEDMNEPDLNEVLHPYVLLKSVLTETDIQKKFSMMYQLPQYFEEAIFAGVGCGKITFIPEDENHAESDANEETLKTPEVSDNPCTAEEPLPILQEPEEMNASAAPAESEEVEEESKGEHSEAVDSEDIAEPASNFENDFKIWNELMIITPESVCYKEQPELLKVETSPKSKDKFGVSKFKNDIAKQACRDKLTCLVEILNGAAYSKESIAIRFGKEKGYYDYATDKLYQLGYLKKYSVSGMGEFYALSSRGKKAFTTKDSFAFIKNHDPNVANNPLFGKMETEETTNAAITRIMLTACYTKAIQIDSSYTFLKNITFITNNSFLVPRIISL